MTALDLHNAIFTSDKRAMPMPHMTRTRTLSLTTVEEQPQNPTSPTYNSFTYQDLLLRQPLHPDGPRHWDLGLDLTGDPITAAECKSLEGRFTKAKLRRLRWICGIFEVVFGIWAIYCTIRYSLAFQTAFTSDVHIRTLALVLCVVSGISFAGVVMTLFMPFLPKDGAGLVRSARMILRGCFVVLTIATAIVNLVFVSVWKPVDRCGWNMDISWSATVTIAGDSTARHCRTASFAVWTIVASFRVVATLIMILLYVYFLGVYSEARHPSRYTKETYYPPLMASEGAVNSPVSTIDSPVSTLDPSSSGTHFDFKLIQSRAAIERSNSMLALTNSSITLAPSPTLSPTQSRSHTHSHPRTQATHTQSSNPAPPASSPIWRNWKNLRLTIKDRQRHNNLSDTPTLRSLRRKNRITISSEHILLNANTTPGAWEECTDVCAVGASLGPDASESDHSVGIAEGRGVYPMEGHRTGTDSPVLAMDSETCSRDSDSVYSYGYGASDPAYPYLEIYNPAPPATANANIFLTQQPRSPAAVIARADIIEPGTSLTTIESGDGEEDELIPIMGGFVRRMATIQSFGSQEAALSMTGSRFSRVSVSEMHTLGSPRSSFGWTPSMASTLSKNNSFGTASAYFSASSDLGMGTGGSGPGIGVNERGELEARMTTNLPSYGRYHYTRDANRATLSVPT
ncbi:uncharacterized protein EDB93DRAFT_320658 [Suillus bovinus]|uniref:uncharacterized protein n=1 Tax=Suillus bovinus TaxID=48563 RepID=UPI001B870ECE|nr:uncharacterized protein EDB93DRAFT_320658 [Suillus bovinus]KAG2151093.1 hypothetical protein EDB93DRAFT_320658 [Suillus bovinus]